VILKIEIKGKCVIYLNINFLCMTYQWYHQQIQWREG